MAGIEIEDGKFAVSFEALDADGKKAQFRSFYARTGEPIALRQPDPSAAERWGRRYVDYPRSTVREGIYESRSIGGYLVFIDKLESEQQVFINWRTGSAACYRRVAIGPPAFHTFLPKPQPNISKLLFHGGRFYAAWMTDSQPEAQLMLSSVDPESGSRHDKVVAAKMGLVTLISMGHIDSHALIVGHRAMLGGENTKIDVFPVTLENPV